VARRAPKVEHWRTFFGDVARHPVNELDGHLRRALRDHTPTHRLRRHRGARLASRPRAVPPDGYGEVVVAPSGATSGKMSFPSVGLRGTSCEDPLVRIDSVRERTEYVDLHSCGRLVDSPSATEPIRGHRHAPHLYSIAVGARCGRRHLQWIGEHHDRKADFTDEEWISYSKRRRAPA